MNNIAMNLTGWLILNDPKSYSSSIKLQKFLFLYNAIAKSIGEEYNLSKLIGYKHGPVCTYVLNKYANERNALTQDATAMHTEHKEEVNESIAKRVNFIVKILSEQELSELSHCFNIWKSKEHSIASGKKYVRLNQKDFNANDELLARSLYEMYSDDMLDNNVIIEINGFNFVISNEDYSTMSKKTKRHTRTNICIWYRD